MFIYLFLLLLLLLFSFEENLNSHTSSIDTVPTELQLQDTLMHVYFYYDIVVQLIFFFFTGGGLYNITLIDAESNLNTSKERKVYI